MRLIFVTLAVLAALSFTVHASAPLPSITTITPPSILTFDELLAKPVGTSTFDYLLSKPVASRVIRGIETYRGPPPVTPISAVIAVTKIVGAIYLADAAANYLKVAGGTAVKDTAPTGWTDSETPPTFTNITYSFSVLNNGSYVVLGTGSTPQEACTAAAGGYKQFNTAAAYGVYTDACRIKDASGSHMNTLTSSNSCPIGYIVGQALCTISGTPQWPSDGVATLIPSGTSLVPHPRDPDSSGITSAPSYTRTGYDANANPVKETVKPNIGGGIDYERQIESVDQSTGTPSVTKTSFGTQSSGQIVSSSEQTYPNSTLGNVVTPTATTITNPTLNFNTDGLATEQTQLANKGLLTDIKTSLTTKDSTAFPTLDTVRTISDSTDLVIEKFKSKFTLPTLSTQNAECPTFSQYIGFFDKTLSITAFCDLDPVIRPVLQTAFTVLWSLLGLFVIFRA